MLFDFWWVVWMSFFAIQGVAITFFFFKLVNSTNWFLKLKKKLYNHLKFFYF